MSWGGSVDFSILFLSLVFCVSFLYGVLRPQKEGPGGGGMRGEERREETERTAKRWMWISIAR